MGAGPMSKENREKLVALFKRGEWILDIDEDYLSTNNPHGIEFRANFGNEAYEVLARVYDADVKDYYNYWRGLEKIVLESKFKLGKSAFVKDETVISVTIMEFREVCITVFPKKVD